MKKILFAAFAFAAVLSACTKEKQIPETTPAENETVGRIVYTLSATMPATKATVNETTGKFEWESGDEIAVWDNEQSKYQVFSTTDSGESATFSYTPTDELAHDFSGSDAYYPASHLNTAHTAIDGVTSLSDASEVPMTATNNNGALTFAYAKAVVKFTVKNVPSFTVSAEFINGGVSYAAEVSHSTNEDIDFYFAIDASNTASSSFNLYDSGDNVFFTKSFNLAKSTISAGDLIPLKTTVDYPILVENNTDWGGLDIYCYNSDASWQNAAFASTAATVKTVKISDKTYSCIFVPSASDTYSFVFRKPNQYYPRVEHKGLSVSKETKIVLNTTNGARLDGDTTPRLIVYNQDKIGPVYLHFWGDGVTGTTWVSNDSEARQMIYIKDSHMEMSSKCTGLIYTGGDLNSGNWYFYYDFVSVFGSATKFNFRLHQNENKGGQFENVTIATNMNYGWWNHKINDTDWDAGAWAL